MSDALVINEIYLSLQGESTFAGLPCVFVRLTACNLRCSYCDTAYAFTEGRKWLVHDVVTRVRELAAPFVASEMMKRTEAEMNPLANERSDGTRSNQGRASVLDCGAAAPLSTHEERVRFSRAVAQSESGAAAPQSKTSRTSEEAGPFVRHLPVGNYRLPLVELTGGEPLLQVNCLPLMTQLCDDRFTVLLETSGAHDIAGIDPRVRRIMDLKCPSSGEVLRNRWENLQHLKATDEVKFVIGTVEDYEWAKQQLAAHQLASICPILFSWVAPLTPEQQDKSLKKVPPGQAPLLRKELAERIIADALPVRFQVQMHKVIWPPAQRGV